MTSNGQDFKWVRKHSNRLMPKTHTKAILWKRSWKGKDKDQDMTFKGQR